MPLNFKISTKFAFELHFGIHEELSYLLFGVAFADEQYAIGLSDKQVVPYDERFTSVIAQRTIRESGIGKMARRDKSLVDKVSAAIILQDYMASVGM